MKSFILCVCLSVFAVLSTSAEGFYLEFKISTDKNNMSGTMKVYSKDGNSRSELSFIMGADPNTAPMMNHAVVTLSLKDNPGKVYSINEEKKTYTEMDQTQKPDSKQYNIDDFDITVLGKENVNGYDATHVMIKNKKQAGDPGQEMWLSSGVAAYTEMTKIKSKYTGHEDVMKALAAKGIEGFPVRMKVMERGNSLQLDLVKAEKRDNPSALFTLEGYTKLSSGASGTTGDRQQMMQQIQNMTPEERQKFIEQMREQQSQPH